MTDEWTVVSESDKKRIAKGRGRRTKTGVAKSAFLPTDGSKHDDDDPFTEIDQARIKAEIASYVEILKSTDLYRNLKELFHDQPTTITFRDMVCYGVGNFATKAAPRWQLACIQCLRGILSIRTTYYFDPCTSPLELEVLKELEISVLTENEQGRRPVDNDAPTLFCMPHCPQSLYNNLLLSNWTSAESLQNIYILGNSLHAYADRQIGTLAKGIEVMLPFTQERELVYSKKDLEHAHFQSAFNDCHLVWVTFDPDQQLPAAPLAEIEKD